MDELGQAVFEVIGQLTTCVEPVIHARDSHLLGPQPQGCGRYPEEGHQAGYTKWGLHARSDKEAIATWRLDINRILHAFNVGSITPAYHY